MIIQREILDSAVLSIFQHSAAGKKLQQSWKAIDPIPYANLIVLSLSFNGADCELLGQLSWSTAFQPGV